LSRIKLFAAEPGLEFFGILALFKAINVEPFFVENGMSPRAERQILAEVMNLVVAVTVAGRAGRTI
jgi:hypothetical protein